LKLLLDTHIWLWSSLEPARLSQEIFKELENPQNELWISPISLWKTVVLAEKGRIILQPDPETWVRTALSKAPMKEASINVEGATISGADHPTPIICRKFRKLRKTQKSGGNIFPRTPQDFGLTRKRVSAERSALAAVGRRPPPQRHTKPPGGEGVGWGA
jgi:PIN domain nuclease of toxin-antitoxin system